LGPSTEADEPCEPPKVKFSIRTFPFYRGIPVRVFKSIIAPNVLKITQDITRKQGPVSPESTFYFKITPRFSFYNPVPQFKSQNTDRGADFIFTQPDNEKDFDFDIICTNYKVYYDSIGTTDGTVQMTFTKYREAWDNTPLDQYKRNFSITIVISPNQYEPGVRVGRIRRTEHAFSVLYP
jgi:hypothetical protein